jgi:WD40 repeat protein
MTSFFRFTLELASLLIICTVISTSNAQQPDRPRLAIDFQGPVGKTRAIGFLPKGNRIFAAGEGKVLELFDIQGQRVTLAGSGRWEFARGARGEINDVAVTRDGRFAFIGGASARGLRDIIIMNLTTRAVVGALPNAPSGRADSKAHNFTPILSVAVSPDSRYAASASRNGEVWLWDLRQGVDKASGRQMRAAETTNSEYNPVAFAGNTVLLYSLPTDASRTQFRAAQVDLATGQKNYVPGDYVSEISAISVSTNGLRVVISSTSGALNVRSAGIASAPSAFSLPEAGVIRNLIVSPDGKMIAAMGDSVDLASSFLTLVNADKIQIIDRIQFDGRESCVTAAFSADGRFAAHDDSRESLLLWNLRDGAGAPIPRPLSQPPLEIGGRGKKYLRGRFLQGRSSVPTGYHVHLDDGTAAQQYSLSDGDLEPHENAPVIDGNTFAAGWTAAFLKTNSITNQVRLTSPAQTVHTISVEIQKQGELTGRHCFIPGANGKPIAIALGTRTVDGIYVYALDGLPPQLSGATSLLRYFRDHSGEISDLSVSSDGRFLLSTSRDKTFKVWSLAGLSNGGKRSIYGSDITIQAGRVVLSNVLKQGVFFGRRLRENDRIIRAENLNVREGGFTDAQGIITVLQNHSPFDEMYLWTERLGANYRPGGDDDRILLVPGWEPLMTLMVDKTDEWVLFTPEGYYNASSAEGHRLFGWQFNRGRDQTPRFERAGNLQKEFEKPGIMDDVLRLGSVADALAANGQPIPGDFLTVLSTQIKTLPEIEITAPRDNSSVAAAAPIVLKADIRFPPAAQPGQFEVRADLGGRSLGEAAGVPGAGGVTTYSWTTSALGEMNQLRVTAKEKNGSILKSLATDRQILVRSQAAPPTPKSNLYVIAFGAENYKFQKPLKFAVDDAKGVFDSFQGHPELSREFSELSSLRTDSEVRKENLTRDVALVMQDVKRRKNPDDLILIYVTGHGVLGQGADGEKDTFFYLPPHVNNEKANELQREGLEWADFAALVNGAPCQVIWAIDACHAGAASTVAKKSLQRISGGVTRRCVFLSTSGVTELAIEDKTAFVRNTDDGHGCFTMAFIETLIGNEVFPEVARKAEKLREDGSLTTDEMATYMLRRVQDQTQKKQTPSFTPSFFKPIGQGETITLLSKPARLPSKRDF